MQRGSSSTAFRSTAGSRDPLVVVGHAVDVAVVVDGEGHAVQRLGAHHAAEAAGVVRVPEGLQDLRRRKTTVRRPHSRFIFHPERRRWIGRPRLLCFWCGYLCSANMVKTF